MSNSHDVTHDGYALSAHVQHFLAEQLMLDDLHKVCPFERLNVLHQFLRYCRNALRYYFRN